MDHNAYGIDQGKDKPHQKVSLTETRLRPIPYGIDQQKDHTAGMLKNIGDNNRWICEMDEFMQEQPVNAGGHCHIEGQGPTSAVKNVAIHRLNLPALHSLEYVKKGYKQIALIGEIAKKVEIGKVRSGLRQAYYDCPNGEEDQKAQN